MWILCHREQLVVYSPGGRVFEPGLEPEMFLAGNIPVLSGRLVTLYPSITNWEMFLVSSSKVEMGAVAERKLSTDLTYTKRLFVNTTLEIEKE